ncbi:MAG: alanine racemase [Alphaproteobacteria bacterium]|nr:alanine racemase [Alphaproteobacteria bacterium]
MKTNPILTIDIGALCKNWRMLCDSAPNAKPAAVVKADAYGTGATKTAAALYDAGCRNFFVANGAEGANIRPHVGDSNIFILNGIDEESVSLFNEHRLTPVISNFDALNIWKANRLPGIRPIIQIDTGLNRLGFHESELCKISDTDKSEFSYVMSHLACADEPGHPMNMAQLTRFESMRRFFPGLPATLSASNGNFLGPEFQFDMVRFGVALYGGLTAAGFKPAPVMNLSAPVLQIIDLQPGESVGYNATFVAKKKTRVAVLAVGYADGLPWYIRISGRGKVFFGNASAPIIGSVCMDLTMVDVSDLPSVKVGDCAEIIGNHYGVDDLGRDSGTISYELLCRIGGGKRAERIYIK